MHRSHRNSDSLIRVSTFVEIIQQSRASIYRDINREIFPKPLKLGNSSRWRFAEVEAYIKCCAEDRSHD